jgi:endonuclease YncB( thermonuclease family)
MYRLLAYALVLLSLGLAQGILMGRASVVDGDTLEIQGVRIRLWGIDAVESSQTCLDASGKPWPCGRRAAFALADFLGQRTVRCERRGTERYGRMVAVCYVGNVEINRWLVEQGWALAYVEYCAFPRPHPTWTARTSPTGTSRSSPQTPTAWTGTGTG